ncbi:WD40 repeat-like protein [Suillus hirtellus]|nr:WD40 repeat-like protein [Suillus hirtellus]
MASPTVETTKRSEIRACQTFEGHTRSIWGVIHLPGRQRIITSSYDGSLRVWNLKSGKQIGEDWRDGEGEVYNIALSPDGKKVVSGSEDGAVRLWDIDTCKVIAKWMGHTKPVLSVCWSRDGQRVLSGSHDRTARQWDVESGETILEPIKTGHSDVWAVVYSPDMTFIATGGFETYESPIKIWDAKTGKLVATLKGHAWTVGCLAWTNDGKTLISGSHDNSIRTWNTTTWKQTAILEAHTSVVWAIAISPNDHILASASYDNTALLWNLDNGQLIGPPLQHTNFVESVSFSEDGNLLATGCYDANVYTWDVGAIVKEAGFDDLLSNSKSALHASATRPPVQRRPPTHRTPRGFFDGVPPDRSHSSARNHHYSSVPPGSTFLGRLFHRNRNPSSAHTTSPSSPLDWARNLVKQRERSGEATELQERSPAVEVPYAKGKRRNASAREVAFAKQKQKQKTKSSHSKISTTGSPQPPKPNIAHPSSQSHTADSSLLSTPAAGDATAATISTTASRPHATIRDVGLWTRFWLFLGCLSPEYTDGHH